MTRNIMRANSLGRNRHPGPAAIRTVTPAQPETAVVVREILALLDGDGPTYLREGDRPLIEFLAVLVRQIREATALLDVQGLADKKGRVRGVAQLLPQLVREARATAESLGMGPQARAKLGLATARTVTLADYVAEKYGGKE